MEEVPIDGPAAVPNVLAATFGIQPFHEDQLYFGTALDMRLVSVELSPSRQNWTSVAHVADHFAGCLTYSALS